MKEHMSPEGLEEAVKEEIGFMVTLTQGEKYRTYIKKGKSQEWVPVLKCFDTEADAIKAVGEQMMLLGSFMFDPKRAVEALLKSLDKQP